MAKINWFFVDKEKIMLGFMVILFLLLLLPSPGFSQSGGKKGIVNVGLLFDGDAPQNASYTALLQFELNALLSSSYDIRLGKNHTLNGQWAFETIKDNYDQLVSDPNIHIIIGAGAITGPMISRRKFYEKPVIAIGIIDPIVQGLSPVVENKSGIHNLNYIISNRSIIKDLETFHRVYPYKTLGFIYYGELSKTMTRGGIETINHLMDKNSARVIKIPVQKSIEDVFEYLDKVDAVYISYLGKFDGEDKQSLINKLNERKIPSFGASLTDARSGMLAAMAPDDIMKKNIRRISLNIEAILEGKDPSEFKISTEFEKKLTINMKTADQIGFSPKFTILSQAELINEHYFDATRTVNLVDVMKESVKQNLDLQASQTYVENAAHDISRAQSDYYPQVSAEFDGVVIDGNRAENSSGIQSEFTTTGNIYATQLIYSDQVLGNIESQKSLYQSSQYDHKNTELDVVFKAINAYFRILTAKTSRKILKDNVELIKRNLKTAEQREMIGHSGRSDVLRWKSQLATTSTELLSASQEVHLAKNDLNRILNRSQAELFHIEEASLNYDIFSIYVDNAVEKYIDNQKSLDTFTRFFIEQSIENSVEIKGLNKKILSFERTILSLKRKHYLPTVTFSVNPVRVFSRNGSGADVPGTTSIDNPWSAGVYLNLPLFEGGSTSIDIKKALVEISRIQKQKSILIQEIEKNARIALSEVVVKMVNLDSSKQAAMYAKQNLELVQDSYAKGTVSVVELADAQNNSLTSELSAISSIYEYLLSRFEMERVYGGYSLLMPLDSKERILNKFKTYMKCQSIEPLAERRMFRPT